MKIFLITNHSFMLYKFRKELIKELLKEHQVTLVMPAKEFTQEFKDMGCSIVDIDVDRRGINPVKDLHLLKQYYGLLKNNKPEMVLTYSIKPNIYAGLSARLLHIPYCSNITGLGTAFQKPFLAKFVTMLYKIGFSKVKTVFFENESNMNLFLDKHIISSQQACLLNGAGVNIEEFYLAPYEACDTTRFIFVGRIMKEKGVDELFEAFKKLVDDGFNVHLDILGFFEDEYENIINEFDDRYYTYLGFQNDVRPFLTKAHCLVLPSYHEGMANTILEAASMGRAVIASHIPGCKEGIDDKKSGLLVNVKDSQDLYEKMKEFVLMDNHQKQTMGLNARHLMEERFDKMKVVEKTIENIVK